MLKAVDVLRSTTLIFDLSHTSTRYCCHPECLIKTANADKQKEICNEVCIRI